MTRSTSVLLGAGASMDAGLPDARGLMDDLSNAIRRQRDTDTNRLVSETLDFVHGVVGNRAPGGDSVDVESVMTALQLLADRGTNPLAPFVKRWRRWKPSTRISGSRVAPEYAFTVTHNRCLEQVVDLLQDPGDTKYLEPILSARSPVGVPLTVATLNYDLTFEGAVLGAGKTFDQGVSDYSNDFVHEWDPDVDVRLLKIHGSINWEQVSAPDRPGILTSQLRLVKAGVTGPVPDSRVIPAVIVGGQYKLRPSGPFLRLHATWEEDLSIVDDLLVVGYSMRDDHINEVIRRWLFADSGRRVAVVRPSWSPEESSFAYDLAVSLAPHDRLIIVEEGAKSGIPRALKSLRAGSGSP